MEDDISVDDTSAINRLKTGHISGLQSLVERYQAQAVDAAALIVRDRPMAEEIVQEAFLRGYHRIAQFDASRPFKPWFFRMVVNDAIKAAKRQKHQVSLDEPGAEVSSALIGWLEAYQDPPETLALRNELCRQVEQALAQLPPVQRGVIVRRYYLGLSDQELAEELHCAPGTVRWYLSLARQRLRVLLLPILK